MRFGKLLMLLLLAAMLAPHPAVAAPQEEEIRPIGGLSFKDEVELTVVNIDVFVRDKKGNPIPDLPVDAFRILQDGTEKEITNFAIYDEKYFAHQRTAALLPGPTPTPGVGEETVPEQPEPQPVYIVLYVDNENLRQFDRNRVLNRVRDFVREVMVPNVQVMVVSYQRSLKVLQPFTNETKPVLDALRSVRTVASGLSEVDNRRNRLLRDLQRQYQNKTTARGSTGRELTDLYGLIRNFADERANNLTFTLQGIREVGTMIGGLQGRKYLVYISNGLPMYPGKELMYELSAVYQETPLLSLLMPYNKTRNYSALASSANAQGITFYTIDATGLDPGSHVSAEHSTSVNPTTPFIRTQNNQSTLHLLAERTGGIAVVNTNDFGKAFEKIKADLFTYYSIGYTINTSGGDKVHNIEVQTPEHPEYDLRFRRTFVEKSLESKVQDKVATGLVFDLNENPMGIETTVAEPAPAPGDRWLLPIEVSFPMKSIALIPEQEDYIGRVVLFVAARDEDGSQSDLQRQEHELRVPAADHETRADERMVIELRLLMEPGSYRIAVGLMDQVTRQTSYQTVRKYIRGED